MRGSLRQASFAAAAAIVVLTAVAAALIPATGSATRAAGAASCTYEQKQAAEARLRNQQRALAAQRARYFRTHRDRAQRAAFVRRQQARLRSLRAAAACAVAPLAPGSSASCNFMLAPNQEDLRANAFGFMILNEGPLQPGLFVPSRGRVSGIVLMVDFPDFPGNGSAAATAELFAPDRRYFGELSYGRFELTLSLGDRWFRLPNTAETYFLGGDFRHRYFADAVAAADPYVDFSRYRFVVVVPTPRFAGGLNNGWARMPGFGVRSAEGEIRLGAMLTGDNSRFGPGSARVANHEFMHAMGLPDLYFDDGSTRTWDPMSLGPGLPATPSVHLLGWHKWRLGWLDPQQLTCVTSPGVLDETLTAVSTAGGKKLVVVPTSAWTTYVVEVRTKTGYDKAICEEGVLVYDVDSRIGNAELRNGRGVVAIKGPRRCFGTAAGALRTGEVFEDSAVKVEVLARDAKAFRVRVTRK